eukprot:6185774-Pleurochrysis_carterae.AAC.3
MEQAAFGDAPQLRRGADGEEYGLRQQKTCARGEQSQPPQVCASPVAAMQVHAFAGARVPSSSPTAAGTRVGAKGGLALR